MYVGGCFCKSSFFRLKLVLTLPLSLAFLPFLFCWLEEGGIPSKISRFVGC